MTVREMIQMMILNCDLDDQVSVEYKQPTPDDNGMFRFVNERPRRVFHMGDGEAVIECHDD